MCSEGESTLIERISETLLSAQQKALLGDVKDLPMYRLLREPSQLHKIINWKKYSKMSIWRDNGTLICLLSCKDTYRAIFLEERRRYVSFLIYDQIGTLRLHGAIYGDTNTAIAETATFFWSLHQTENEKDILLIGSDVASYQFHPEQLAQIFDANPSRQIELDTGTWSAKQSVILATRPYPLHLTLGQFYKGSLQFHFADEGTAFVDALEQRPSSFGTLFLEFNVDEMPLSRTNLKRLLQLEHTFEKLATKWLDDDDFIFLPFSSKVQALDYYIDGDSVEPDDLKSLDIVAKYLSIHFYFDFVEDWDTIFVAFLNRLAELGHFERLKFSVDVRGNDHFDSTHIAEALVRAIQGNPKLMYLDLGNTHWRVDWVSELKPIFKAMEEHPGLQTFVVKRYIFDWESDDEEDSGLYPFDHSWLERLLSRNRNITVLGNSGKRYSNGSRIENLYLLNHVYIESKQLVKETASMRPLLVSTALAERVSGNFQHTSLVLADHTDVLCEFVDGIVNVEAGLSCSSLSNYRLSQT